MSRPPDDNDKPGDDKNPGDDEHSHDGPIGMPPGAKPRKLKVVISQSAQDVKFADLFGFTLGPTHGIVKFGVLQPETGEFVIHTQIALTPQGMVALSQALQKNLEKIRQMSKQGPGPGPKMN
jgi:hypothetical protein